MATKLKAIPTLPDAAAYPAAPRGLSKRQRTLWRDITRSKPVAWWDTAAQLLLAALVGHIETLERLQSQVTLVGDLASPAALARLEQLSRLRDRESKQVAMLSTRMRLTAQSRYEPRRAGRDGRLRAADDGNPFASFRTRRTAA